MTNHLKEHMISRKLWIRAFYMILFALIYSIADTIIAAVVVVQFVFVLFTGERIQRLLTFGADLSVFVYQVLRFLSFNTEDMPFPFGDWPGRFPRNGEGT